MDIQYSIPCRRRRTLRIASRGRGNDADIGRLYARNALQRRLLYFTEIFENNRREKLP